jgi:hypothetical protein
MKLIQGDRKLVVNTISNWPLIEDLFIKWGHADITPNSEIEVNSIDSMSLELSAWGIPWKRDF